MTGQGLLQLASYLLVLLLLVKPLGAYMAAVFEGRRTFLSPLLEPVERLIYRVAGVDPAHESNWQRYAWGVLLANLLGLLAVYALQRLQARATPQSPAVRRSCGGFRVQYRGQLRHQHQLARVRGRSDHESPDADARARRAELPVGRLRNRGAGRTDPRFRPPRVQHDRRVLGRPHARHALRVATPVRDPCGHARGSGRRAELRPAPAGEPRRAHGHQGPDGHRADAAARPGGQPGCDQAARHQRRRVLQHKLGTPVREPDAGHEFPRDAGDPADPGGALLHVRQHGQGPAPGLGVAGRDAGDLRAVGARDDCRGAGR